MGESRGAYSMGVWSQTLHGCGLTTGSHHCMGVWSHYCEGVWSHYCEGMWSQGLLCIMTMPPCMQH